MNVSRQISDIALLYPSKDSVVCPVNKNTSYKSYTFSELERKINQFSNKLSQLGVRDGDKVLIFIKPDIDFAAIVFAVFRVGAVGVFIDPGMGRVKLLNAIEESGATVLIGINKVHILRRIFKSAFNNINLFITNSKSSLLANSLYLGLDKYSHLFNCANSSLEDLAAILYTSGGTGKPKGVQYTHQMFIEQTKKLKSMFKLTHEDVDLAGFPLFAMFTLSMGMTSVIPHMDPSSPAKAKPSELLKNIMDYKVTFVAGSPAIWHNMLDKCIQENISLEAVKYFVMFGAPIPYSTHLKFSKILPNGTTYTPYGATECLPVSNISGAEILKEFTDSDIMGKGICIGTPVEGVRVRINKLHSHVIEELAPLQIGEIIVDSSTATKGYFDLTEKTKASKIIDTDTIWHRMGDTGFLDGTGRLWFTGRVAHSFNLKHKDFFSIPVEQYFLRAKNVEKAALVQVTEQTNALIIQGANVEVNELKSIASKNALNIDHFLFHKKFPVDIRHNIKIDRQALGLWARKRI